MTLTVVASIRHQNTDYDQLLKAGVPCAVARQQVRPTVDMARIFADYIQGMRRAISAHPTDLSATS